MKNPTIKRKVICIIMIVLGILLAGIVGLVVWLLILSPGTIEPYYDQSGNVLEDSIAEKTFITIGGVKQGMIIKSKNIQNPVLLFLHGGPGMSTYFLAEKFPTGLEDYFTVCYWEQRGGGISYSDEITAESMKTEQIISDAIEVTNYLCECFGQDKIYLMGHSWGSYIGIQTAGSTPELYYAYIGVSQIAHQSESEKIAHDYMIEQYTADGNTKMVEKLYDLSESDETVLTFFKSSVRDSSMHDLGIGTMRDMKSVISGVFWPVMQCNAYTLGEKINIWKAKSFLANDTELIDELFATDMTTKVTELEIPVYFLCGSYDYTVNYGISKDYLAQLQAPVKGFYTFRQSAHSSMHEEPEYFVQIMTEDVLNGTTNLAD